MCGLEWACARAELFVLFEEIWILGAMAKEDGV